MIRMKTLAGILDRILFAGGLVVFLQIPQFVDHYTQRYAGYQQALTVSVGEYQLSADAHYAGDLGVMVHEFKNDDKPAMRELGSKIERERTQLTTMTAGLAILQGDSLAEKLVYLAGDFDSAIAEGTLQDFKPGMPLTADAWICGVIGAILLSGLLNLLLWLGRQVRLPRQQTPPTQRT